MTSNLQKIRHTAFGEVLVHKLKEAYNNRVETTLCDVKKWIPRGCQNENYYELQIKAEIPHQILRANYRNKKEKEKEKEAYIWDTSWIEISKQNHHQFNEK